MLGHYHAVLGDHNVAYRGLVAVDLVCSFQCRVALIGITTQGVGSPPAGSYLFVPPHTVWPDTATANSPSYVPVSASERSFEPRVWPTRYFISNGAGPN